jgi:hypothetical protein
VAPGWHDGLFYDEPSELRDLRPETDCEAALFAAGRRG